MCLPDVCPQRECQKGNAHNQIAEIGERVDAEQTEYATENVHDDCDGEEYGWRACCLENIFTLIVCLVFSEFIVQIDVHLFQVFLRKFDASHFSFGTKL